MRNRLRNANSATSGLIIGLSPKMTAKHCVMIVPSAVKNVTSITQTYNITIKKNTPKKKHQKKVNEYLNTQKYEIFYTWGNNIWHKTDANNKQEAERQAKVFIETGAKDTKVAKQGELEIMTFDMDMGSKIETIIMPVYKICDGLWIIEQNKLHLGGKNKQHKFVVMTKTGLWFGGTQKLTTAIEIAEAVKYTICWDELTKENWKSFPQIKKDEIYKIIENIRSTEAK